MAISLVVLIIVFIIVYKTPSTAIAEKKKQRIKEHWRDYRPSKEKWNEIKKEHRHYKQNLYLQGELK